MRIAVNLLPFRAQLFGAGRYTQNILRELLQLDTKNEYHFFVAPRAATHFSFDAANVRLVTVGLPDSTVARIAYEQLVLPIQLLRYETDVLFTPSVAVPVVWGGKSVTVIYDMIAEHRDVTKYSPLRNAYVRTMSRFAALCSTSVVTISENSRREIVHYARIPQAKIALAPPATDLERVTDAETLGRVRDAYRLPKRFILYLGTLEPGKNLPRLIQAFGRFKHRRPDLEHHLVLAGAQGWGVDALEKEIQKSETTGFHLVGFVQQEDLAAMYSLADVFVYPSLYEGFGMPPLEAMACGTPVVVSNVSSLPEVLGDPWTGKAAGLAVSPEDIDGLANAMVRILTDEALRDRLRAMGLARASEFSWNHAARVVAQRIVDSGGP